MAVGDNTYGLTAGVQQKVGWVVPSRTFSASTTPTTTEVENILDQIAAEIHAKLAENGYPVSTKTVVTTNAPRAVKWLEMLNEAGACAEIVMSFGIAGDPETAKAPEGYWKKRYEDGMKMIAGAFLEHLGLARSRDLSDLMVCTAVQNTDGEDKLPVFRRGMFDYPGARSLTEED